MPTSPSSSDITTALADMGAARQALLAKTQAVHDLVAAALANALRPGDVVAHDLPALPSVQPTVFVKRLGVARGRGYDAVAFEVISAPTVVIHPENLNNCEWTCTAVPISNKTGKPMSARTGGKLRTDSGSTVVLRATIPGGFEGVVCASQDPADRLAAFVTTYQAGRPDVGPVRDALLARREASRQAKEADTLRRLAEDPNGFLNGVYLGDSGPGLLRGKGLGGL